MNKSFLKIIVFSIAMVFQGFVFAAEMNVPIQLKLKAPDGSYPTVSGVAVQLLILSTSTGCVLRDESFSAVNINNGSLSLALGSGVRGGLDPNLSLNLIYDNSKPKLGLNCVDANNNILLTGQTYTPSAVDDRIIRISTNVLGSVISANFNMRATPYAIQAESVGGKTAASILIADVTTQLNQTNLASLLFDSTRVNNLINFAISGQASSATTATNATTAINFSGALGGDISGLQSAISVDKIKGTAVSTTLPALGQVLQFNGSQYVPVNIPSAPVTSVAGRAGAVVLSNTDIAGLGAAALLNVGTVAGTVAAGDDLRIINAVSSAVFNGYVVSANCSATQSMYWNTVSSQFLCQNINFPAGGAVTSVAGRAGAVVLSNADIAGLGAAALLNVGTVAGTVAAGDDLRIVGAFTDISAATSLNTASVLVKRDATGGFSAGSVSITGDITVSGAIAGLAQKTAIIAVPTTAGTAAAYTLSYGAAMDAKIITNTIGDTVHFKVNAANTGAATLKVAGAAAAPLFSAFTGLSVNASDLQIGFYSATFDGTNWVVQIPPKIFKAVVNWTGNSATTIVAAGVNVTDYVTCGFSNNTATAMTTGNYWRQSVLVHAGKIDVVGVISGAPPAITGISCLVQK